MMGFCDAVASAGPQQTICTSLQTDNHTSTSSLNFSEMLFLTFNQSVKTLKAIDFHVIEITFSRLFKKMSIA